MPPINNEQSDILDFFWVFVLKSSNSADNKPGNASTEATHYSIDDRWGRCKYCLKNYELLGIKNWVLVPIV